MRLKSVFWDIVGCLWLSGPWGLQTLAVGKSCIFIFPLLYLLSSGPALSTRGNLARARAHGAGSPRTVEHRYLPGLGRYETLMMRAKE